MQYSLQDLKTITALYVEDEQSVRDTVYRTFVKLFKQVYIACDGEEGLEVFKQHQNDIEIVITDINMPKLNGLDMINQIKEIKELPSIVTTAYTDKELLLKAMELNIDKYVTKPIKIKELVNNISLFVHENRNIEKKDINCEMISSKYSKLTKENRILQRDNTILQNENNILKVLNTNYICKITTDNRGIINSVSAKFIKLYGYSETEIINKKITQIQEDPSNTTDIQKYMLEMTYKKQSVYAVHKFKTKSGELLECDMTMLPSYDEDGLVNGYTFYQDLIHI